MNHTTASVEGSLGRIEERVDGIRSDVKDIKELVIAQNGRIRTLELERAERRGGWTVLALVGSAAGAVGGLTAKWFGQ